ncbi:unnamed protein product [Gongylonema pulchrum]|uniref:Uncharacterized protein n=1 Tax=Gongylonema pulchrum TaxID=637853 RepID=A0A3P7NG28_9BILA|nr:unnamed protein product [Gongylonema pulchrum]
MEAIRDRRYEDVIPLVEQDLAEHAARGKSELTAVLRDCILMARFELMKENVEVTTFHFKQLFQYFVCLHPLSRSTHSRCLQSWK